MVRRARTIAGGPDPLSTLLSMSDRGPRRWRAIVGLVLLSMARGAGAAERTSSTSAVLRAVGLHARGDRDGARAFALGAATSGGPSTRLAMARFLDAIDAHTEALQV